MKRIFIVGVILCCSLIEIFAQSRTWTIKGIVTDDRTGTAVDYANVLLYNVADSTLAAHTTIQSDGAYALECKNAGTYYLVISFIGYETVNIPGIQLSEGQRNILIPDIRLKPSQQELSEVEIVGQRRQIVYKLDKQVVNASTYISAAGGTAVDILAQTPSISVDADGEVSFRGSTGFKVYIDGRPSSLEGTAALEQMPAGQIESIEIITTPSARNDADGTAGIINIITKKQNIEGWSGMVNLMGSSAWSSGMDFLLSLRKKDIQWQLSGGASRRYLWSDFDQMKTIYSSETVTTDHSTGERERHTDNYYLKIGLDKYKKNTTWSAAIQGGYGDRWRGGELHYENTYNRLSSGEMSYASYNGNDFVNLYEWNLRGDAGMEHRFPDRKGHLLTASLYGLYQGDAMEYFETNMFNLDGSRVQGHKAWEFEYRFTAQANVDYIYPFANEGGKFESGYRFYTYTEDGDYKIDMFDAGIDDFVRRDDLYNKFLFRHDIHALYTMLSDTHSRFSYQLGLRGEYTYRELGNNEEWARHVWNKFDIFPSVHLAFALGKDSRTSFAYSRRITQPQLFYMEPYIVYVDFYTAQRGNPFILPEYTNSVEWGYNKTFSNSNTFSGALFHRARKDKIERIRVPYKTEVTLDSMTNVGNDYSTGAELSAMLYFKPWWNFDGNGSLYYYRIKNEYKIDEADEKSWNWRLAANNNFELSPNTRIRLEANYVGPSVSTQGRVEDFFYLNLTVRQQMFRKRLTVSLSARDILSTAKYTSTRSSVGMESFTKIHPRSPLFTLTLAYTFNNFKSQRKTEQDTDLFEGTNR